VKELDRLPPAAILHQIDATYVMSEPDFHSRTFLKYLESRRNYIHIES